MQVKSTVKLNMPRIRQLTDGAVTALKVTAEELHTEVANAQVVPMDTGQLTGEAFFCDFSEAQSGKVSLIHNTPYARRLYYHPEYKFQKEYHSDARGKWLEDWLAGGKNEEFAAETFKRIYKKVGDV